MCLFTIKLVYLFLPLFSSLTEDRAWLVLWDHLVKILLSYKDNLPLVNSEIESNFTHMCSLALGDSGAKCSLDLQASFRLKGIHMFSPTESKQGDLCGVAPGMQYNTGAQPDLGYI